MRRSMLLAIFVIAVVAIAGVYTYYQSVFLPEEAQRLQQEKWRKTLILGTNDYLQDIDLFSGTSGMDTWTIAQSAMAVWYSDPLNSSIHHPGLADTWEWKTIDGKPVLDIHIKEGVKFQDGYPVNTSAVLWTWTNLPSHRRYYHDAIYNKAEALDLYNIRIWLKTEAFGPQIVEYLGGTSAFVISPSTYVNGSIAKSAGPWEIVEFIPDEKIVFKAHPEYPWGPKYLDTMIVQFYKDTSSMRLALEKGEVDAVIRHLGYPDLADLAKNEKLTVEVVASGYSRALIPNKNMVPWNITKVRQALAYVINPQPVIDTAYYGYAIPSKSWVPPTLPYSYDIFYQTYRTLSENERIAKARALLTEAGYPNGFKSELWYSSRAASKETEEAACLMFKNQLAKVGIDVELKFAEWGAYLDLMGKNTSLPLQLGHWAYSYADPDYMLTDHMSIKGWWSKFTGYSNSHVEDLLVQGRQLYDPDVQAELNTARKAIYEELQTILANDAVLVTLYHQVDYFVYQKYVKGGPFCPWYYYYISFTNASKVNPP